MNSKVILMLVIAIMLSVAATGTFVGVALIMGHKQQVVKTDDLTINFERYEQPWQHDNGELLSLDDFELNYEGTRLYQFHETGKIGRIVRYTIKSKSPSKPLADHGKVKRDEQGKIQYPYKPHTLCLKVNTDNDKWAFARAEGLYTEHWKPNGEIQCVGFANDMTVGCYTWEDGIITIEVHPQDGFYGTGEPVDVAPLHSIEIDFYFYPK